MRGKPAVRKQLCRPQSRAKRLASAAHRRGAALLKTVVAIDGASLGRLKGHFRLASALSAGDGDVRAFGPGSGRPLLAVGIASLATFGFVLKIFLSEEASLSGCKQKVAPAVDTLQHLIGEFRHGARPDGKYFHESTMSAGPDTTSYAAQRLLPTAAKHNKNGFGTASSHHRRI